MSKNHLNLNVCVCEEREREGEGEREYKYIWIREPTAWMFPAARLCSVPAYRSLKVNKLCACSPNCPAWDLEASALGEVPFLPAFLGGGSGWDQT